MDTLQTKPVSQMGGQRWRLGEGAGYSDRELKAAEDLDAKAGEWGIPAPQLALAWLLSRPAVASVIIGPESVAELEQNAPAGELQLSEWQLKALDAIGA